MSSFLSYLRRIGTGGGFNTKDQSTTATYASASSIAFKTLDRLTQVIKPRSSSSKILLCIQLTTGDATHSLQMLQIFRDEVQIGSPTSPGSRIPVIGGRYNGQGVNVMATKTYYYVDQPATTSEVTYTLLIGGDSTSAGTILLNSTTNNTDSNVNYKATSAFSIIEV